MKLLKKDADGFALYGWWKNTTKGRFLKMVKGRNAKDSLFPGSESLWIKENEIESLAKALLASIKTKPEKGTRAKTKR